MNDSTESRRAQAAPARWLLLIHQLPPEPAYLRVKIRRRLARLGAHALKNTVYVLPWSEAAVEDFQWLRREIESLGGEAILWEAILVDGLTDSELETRFRTGRRTPRAGRPLAALPNLSGGRTWVTRRGVEVDRIASAWLIRRFIDPKARFKFVQPRGYRPAKMELRFDMYDAEYTHEGNRCSFEVLLERFGLRDPALRVLGEVIHDLDLKDEKFARPEAAGVGRMLAGVIAAHPEDGARLERGGLVLDALYASYREPGRRAEVTS